MKCDKCDALLFPGNDTCPNCGNVNSIYEIKEQTEELLVENSKEEKIEQLPPSLNVNDEEILTSGIVDINEEEDVPTYEIIEENSSIPQDFQEEIKDIEVPSNDPVLNVENNNEDSEKKAEEEINLEVKDKKIKFPKKNVSIFIFLGGIIAFFLIGILIGSTFFTKNTYVASGIRKTTTKQALVADGKNNITNAGNYTFKIPSNYYYDKNNGGVLIYDSVASFRIYIKPIKGIYTDIVSAKTSIKESLKEIAVSVNQIKEIKINKSDLLVIETTEGIHNRLVAFMEAKNEYVYFIEIITSDNKYNYDLLNIAEDIAINATYKETELKLENVYVNNITDLVIRATEAYKSLSN